MKKVFLIIFFFCGVLTVPILAQAFRTYRVNNMLTQNPAAKIYTTVQAAHDAANNGDTILIEGSPVQYSGEFNCVKKLVIKGPGYFLHENPGISANKARAELWMVTFGAGSAGSVIMGIECYYSLNINIDDITVRRCHLHGCSINPVKNVKISECIFSGGQGFGGGSVTNLTIANCIINRDVAFGYSSPSHGTGSFLNNIFTVASVAIPTGFVMKNNIFFFTEKPDVYLPSLDAAVSYNMSIADHFGTANNNKANVGATTLFVGDATESTDGRWLLKAGSPAIAAGEGGADCGAYGGPNPYILSGLPVGPTIYELNVSSYVNPAGKLPMTIKVKSY
jgi:hypothetical protein